MKKRICAMLLATATLICSACGGTPAQTEFDMTFNEGIPVQVVEDNYRTYYEVFLYSFYDSNQDGIGDIQGLISKLDYINDGDASTDTDLGLNGIWLMPVMPSTTYHKYDVTDYCAIDEQYGTMQDFEELIKECDKRGIKVIIDMVLNHSSSEHPWFQSACTYLAELGDGEIDKTVCPEADFYHFTKEPVNAYYPVPGSDVWYYEAQFWEGMPDLNLANKQVRANFEDIAKFWMDKGVGGFRMDAVQEFYTGADSASIEVLTWYVDMVKSYDPEAYIVAEMWNSIDAYAPYYASGIDSMFDFEFAGPDGIIASVVKGSTPASGFGKALEALDEKFGSYNSSYIDAPFYTNHDLARSAGYYSGDWSMAQTKMAGALNLLMSGSSFIYYGEELGMKGAGKDENKRAPMYWLDDKSAEGMCAGPENMDSIKMKYGSYEQQITDANSIYQYYKNAIRLRNHNPGLMRGATVNLEELSTNTITAFKREYGEEQWIVIGNISSDMQEITIPEDMKVKVQGVLCTNEEKILYKENLLTLPAYGIVIFKEESLNK